MTDPARPLSLVANWKMNGSTGALDALLRPLAEGAGGAGAGGAVRRVVCPPFPLLAPAAARLAGAGFAGVALGAQDCSPHPGGAHTGEVSAGMLREAGCRVVLLGHSERRRAHGEDAALVAAKARAARAAGLAVVLCLGEETRDGPAPAGALAGELGRMLDGGGGAGGAAAAGGAGEPLSPPDLAVAYEPVWAIGAGRAAEPGEVKPVVDALRGALEARFGAAADEAPVLYGGSVAPGNAAGFVSEAGADGLLVGGASLDPEALAGVLAALEGARRPV